jgi:glycyl-tRNA synthetase
MMAFLIAAYDEEVVPGPKDGDGDVRTVLRLDHRLAPYQVAVLPLSRKDTLTPMAREVLALLQPHYMVDYDETQAIGRRYRRQDEVGTPYCVTVDFDSLEDQAVTVRDRDSMEQERVAIAHLVAHLQGRLG